MTDATKNQPEDISTQAMREHGVSGGSTFDVRSGKNLSGSRHFAVSVAPEATAVFDRHPAPADHANFIAQHHELLSRNANSAIGSHHDPATGLHRLEIVAVTPSKKAALEMASHLGEKSVHSLATDERHQTGAAEAAPSHLSIDERFQQLAASAPQKSPYTGTHFSDAPLDVIDGNRRGASQAGAESSRLHLGSKTGLGKDAPAGFYTYAAGSLPDAAHAQRKSAQKVRGQFAFASTNHPEFQQGYADGSRQALDNGADPATAHGIGLNHAEHALQDVGFDGYFSSAHPHVRFHFGSHALETPVNKRQSKET